MSKKRKVLAGLVSLTLWDIAAADAAPFNPYSWSGFYLGAHAGVRWANPSFSGPGYDFDTGSGVVTSPPRSESYNTGGGIVGVHTGYNYMITPAILAGIEGDWTWGSGSESRTGTVRGVDDLGDGFTLAYTSEVRLTWQGTIRGRLGYVTGPWLFYGTGGAAFARINWSDTTRLTVCCTSTFASSAAGSKTLTGVAVGGGVEYMISPNWIGRIEYLYEHFGDFNVPFGLGQTGTLDLKDVSKLRIGISYKLGP